MGPLFTWDLGAGGYGISRQIRGQASASFSAALCFFRSGRGKLIPVSTIHILIAASLRTSDLRYNRWSVGINDDSADSNVGAVALRVGRRDLAADGPADSEASRCINRDGNRDWNRDWNRRDRHRD